MEYFLLKAYLFSLSILLAPMDHDIHVSINEIEIIEDKAEITIKTFLDDLQLAVGLVPGEELPEDYTSADEMISAYIKQSIQISINDSPVSLDVIDITAATDAVWISLEAPVKAPLTIEQLSIKSQFLTEIYDDQRNIFKITCKNKKITELLDSSKITFDAKF